MIILVIIITIFLILNICLTIKFIKVQKKHNELYGEHICKIYDIIKYNGLKREGKNNEK